ncbi:hypothetical protein amb4266 [Paramagnetospirillum magneticum AMB-1]|uniref:Uncharacterized protein n=1 Tax=Paramagnetospirillum magneticum (strain ATCC 700264 / AMB-1) TaxID=342108 RepID=Q2VZA5_PARM1|nr:hypothetical protein amb4266 [Paramagnetospirillum magneticum AMB-1]
MTLVDMFCSSEGLCRDVAVRRFCPTVRASGRAPSERRRKSVGPDQWVRLSERGEEGLGSTPLRRTQFGC